MFLKSLTLKGFKSFAESTTLEFEPGVTVVVGPNGSGKSNVVDAVAWVLGAQGAKALRGGRMDDVIFAGTARRQELGRAEVTLTIDNSSGRLPVAAAEMSITRTLFRDGDSQYALNGAPCRLLDVQELLSDAGVGRTQHVIVGQGQLDSVLEAKPEERRAAIEEAAGILKYRKRRERAQRRLEATQADLERLGDIEGEVRRQLRPLERQAEAARRHGVVTAELRRLRRQVGAGELAALEAAVSKAREALSAASARHRSDRAGLERADEAVAAAEAGLSAAAVPPVVEDLLRRAQQVAARSGAALTVVEERARSLSREASLAVDAAGDSSLATEREALESALEEVERAAGALAPDLAQLTEKRAQLEQRREAVRAHERRVAESLRAVVPRPDGTDLAGARSELAGLLAGMERDQSTLARLALREAELSRLTESGCVRLDQLAAEVAAAEQECERAAESKGRLDRAAEEAGRVRTEAQERLQQAQSDVRTCAARIEALSIALSELRDRSGATYLDGLEGVLGSLAESVSVSAGWEKALAAALGDTFGGVVVNGHRTALEAAARLVGEGHFAVLLPLSSREGTGRGTQVPDDGAVRLRDLVRGRTAEIENMLDQLLGHVVAVDGPLADAVGRHLATGQVVVTREGDVIGPDGWRVGATSPGVTASALDQAAVEADAAAAECSRAQADKRDADEASAEAGRAAAAGRSQAAEVQRRYDALADQFAGVSQELQRRKEELAGVAEQASATSARRDADARRCAELEQTVAKLELAENQATEAAQSAAQEAGRLSGQLAAERHELASRAEALSTLEADLQARAAALEERRSMLRARHSKVVADQERNREAGERLRRRQSEISAALAACAALGLRARSLQGSSEDMVSRLALVHSRHRRQLELANEVVSNARLARAALAQRVSESSEALLDRRSELSEAEARLAGSTETWHQKLGCYQPCDGGPECRLNQVQDGDGEPSAGGQPSGTGQLRDGIPSAGEPSAGRDGVGSLGHDEAVARMGQLESELRKIGPVNPLALEQAAELRDRSAFVSAQLEDVKAARRELGKVIRAVDEEIVATFESAWQDVASNFENLLQAVFPGGTGALRLVGEEDMLTAGVEIEARPAGKAVKKLSLLSGGERSLVALAFLFSLFRSRPSPFYLMDEVEAALDDVNLNRFLSLVGELRRHAQLLLVSHQKRTMEMADCLYGVTMQPGGSSKVVSERVAVAAATS
ncbi:MAG: chromosome segregation protein SMC [Actinomycetota bacterium]|nr:chromosome segregation protein SMC [Actinomycetota bacterium]